LALKEHKYFMEKEIFETPTAIKNTYNSIKNNADYLLMNEFKKITLVGCGTAYHSCLIGEYLLKNELNKDIETFLASNYTLKYKIKKNHLHIIVSQSGETADCIKVAEEIKHFNGKLLLITNEPHSTLAKMADYHIFTNAEKEIAVASTKTYCCQLFIFAYICHRMKNQNFNLNIDTFTEQLNDFIMQLDIGEVAQQLKSLDKLILIAKDIDYVTILEASLKIREIDYLYTLPMYAGELKHGTLSLITEDSFVLTLNTDSVKNKLQSSINEIKSRQGKVIDFSNYIPKEIDEYFKPIFAIIPFQLLSYKIAVLNGRNPDMPRNLAKSVTVE
ncbi:MAG: SIS domain-containing protein, partial [Clostridia bacterium]|nr:SIS domain-containing protein [Clostridia bacterium]